MADKPINLHDTSFQSVATTVGGTVCGSSIQSSERAYTEAEVKLERAAVLTEAADQIKANREARGSYSSTWEQGYLDGQKWAVDEILALIPQADAHALDKLLAEARQEIVTPELVESLHAAVAQGWCVPPNTSKAMDCDLALAIVNNVIAALRAAAGNVQP
jgi:hypothetical protein